MRRNMTKILALLLAVALTAVGFTGCSNTPADQTTEAPKQTGAETKAPGTNAPETDESTTEAPPVDYKGAEFRIAWWGNDTRHNNTIKLIEEFEKDFLNLKTQVEYNTSSEYWKTLNTQITGHNQADVLQMTYNRMATYVDAGILLPLDEYIESGALDLSKVAAEGNPGGKLNGVTYGVATGINGACWYYNPAMTEKAGVTISENPTLEEFVEVCEKVYDATGAMISGFNLKYFVRAYGERITNEEGNGVGFTADTLTKFWEFYADGVEYGWMPGPENADVMKNPAEAFANGRIWAADSYTNQLATQRSKTGIENLKMFNLPTVDLNTPAGFLQPNTQWVVSADCKNPELAVAFINYFVNNQNTYDICGTDRGMPINSDMKEHVTTNASDTDKEVIAFLAMLEDGHVSEMDPSAAANLDQATSHAGTYREKVQYGVLTRDQFAAEAQKCIEEMNAILTSTN